MQASKSACKSQKNVVILHRVRQLKQQGTSIYINNNADNNSASPTLLAAKGKCKSTTQTTCFNNLRGNQLPAALKESHVSVNGYIHPFKF